MHSTVARPTEFVVSYINRYVKYINRHQLKKYFEILLGQNFDLIALRNYHRSSCV